MSKNQGLSAEEKVKLVRSCLAGEMSVSEAGRQAGVHTRAFSAGSTNTRRRVQKAFSHKSGIGYIAPK